MKSILVRSVIFCIVSTVSALALSSESGTPQRTLAEVKAITEERGLFKVRGHNNATYGPVPKESQLFQIEFMEIAPSPIPVDRVIFQLLQGEIAPSKRTELIDLDKLLTTATLTISISAILSDGRHEEERSYTVPLRTTAFGYIAHLSIRNETGSYVDYLGSSGTYEIVTECQILSQFLKTGMWTFKVVAELEDKTCLFEMTLTQRLEGRMK